MYLHSASAFPSRQPAAEYPPVLDNPFAPDIFATGVPGIATVNGVVLLTLESARFDHSQANPALERVVVGRLALTTPAAQALVVALNGFLEQQGASPTKAVAQGAAFQ